MSFSKSLRARLIVGAVVWIAIGVSAAGIFISALFRQYTIELVDNELRKDLEELMTLIDVEATGFPHLSRPLSDPRFGEIDSGFTWQVSRTGKGLIKSLSASHYELPVPDDALGQNDAQKLTLDGPKGPMIVFERLFAPDDSAPPLRIQVGVEVGIIEAMLPAFTRQLTGSLILLGLALVAAAALQVWFGLRPMSRLRQALADIGAGKTDKLPTDFPSEVRPLVDDLNNLIDANSQMLLRARTQAGNLAHALKTPLAILTDEAYRLQHRGEAESANVLLQQSQRMQRQIDYQIARARAAASRSVPGILANVAPIVGNIVTAMKRLYDSKSLRIVAEVDGQCVALCDPMDVNEMLANLIDNACKWATTTVAVGAVSDERGAEVVITVDDDGPGLPAQSLDRVFRIGERLDEQVQGSGLGLPIVRDLAHLYGGRVDLENIARGGLRATLRLPMSRSKAAPE
jgi:signal transduction histidine kinase